MAGNLDFCDRFADEMNIMTASRLDAAAITRTKAMSTKTMTTRAALYILIALCAAGCRCGDGKAEAEHGRQKSWPDALPPQERILYDLYAEKKCLGNMPEAMEYAEMLLGRIPDSVLLRTPDQKAAEMTASLADWAGSAVLPISASLSGSAASYRYSVYLGNLTDASRYSDNLITEDLLKNGYSTPNQVFLCDFGVEMTMLAVAFDPDGNPGQVFRRSFSIDRSGISPAEEFDPSLWTTSGRSSAKKASPGIKRPEMPERHAEKIPVRRSNPHKILMLTDTH